VEPPRTVVFLKAQGQWRRYPVKLPGTFPLVLAQAVGHQAAMA